MRLDHLLSREYSQHGNMKALPGRSQTRKCLWKKAYKETRVKHSRSGLTSQRNFAEFARNLILYRLQGSAIRTLTTAQQENDEIQERPVAKQRKLLVIENNWSQDQATKKSSYKEHRVDALAPYADEGRGKLRKASGSRKQALIRRHPNGGTRQPKRLSLQDEYIVL